MRYSLAMTIEASSLVDAWNAAFAYFPQNLTPETVEEAQEGGIINFSIEGGGRSIAAQFAEKPIAYASGGYVPGANYAVPRVPGQVPRVPEGSFHV